MKRALTLAGAVIEYEQGNSATALKVLSANSLDEIGGVYRLEIEKTLNNGTKVSSVVEIALNRDDILEEYLSSARKIIIPNKLNREAIIGRSGYPVAVRQGNAEVYQIGPAAGLPVAEAEKALSRVFRAVVEGNGDNLVAWFVHARRAYEAGDVIGRREVPPPRLLSLTEFNPPRGRSREGNYDSASIGPRKTRLYPIQPMNEVRIPYNNNYVHLLKMRIGPAIGNLTLPEKIDELAIEISRTDSGMKVTCPTSIHEYLRDLLNDVEFQNLVCKLITPDFAEKLKIKIPLKPAVPNDRGNKAVFAKTQIYIKQYARRGKELAKAAEASKTALALRQFIRANKLEVEATNLVKNGVLDLRELTVVDYRQLYQLRNIKLILPSTFPDTDIKEFPKGSKHVKETPDGLVRIDEYGFYEYLVSLRQQAGEYARNGLYEKVAEVDLDIGELEFGLGIRFSAERAAVYKDARVNYITIKLPNLRKLGSEVKSVDYVIATIRRLASEAQYQLNEDQEAQIRSAYRESRIARINKVLFPRFFQYSEREYQSPSDAQNAASCLAEIRQLADEAQYTLQPTLEEEILASVNERQKKFIEVSSQVDSWLTFFLSSQRGDEGELEENAELSAKVQSCEKVLGIDPAPLGDIKTRIKEVLRGISEEFQRGLGGQNTNSDAVTQSGENPIKVAVETIPGLNRALGKLNGIRDILFPILGTAEGSLVKYPNGRSAYVFRVEPSVGTVYEEIVGLLGQDTADRLVKKWGETCNLKQKLEVAVDVAIFTELTTPATVMSRPGLDELRRLAGPNCFDDLAMTLLSARQARKAQGDQGTRSNAEAYFYKRLVNNFIRSYSSILYYTQGFLSVY